MRVLICCEHSGVISGAFRALGHDAWSCDLLNSEDKEASAFHLKCDCREVMGDPKWDLIGMHPDCTYLTVAGIHWNDRGRGWEKTEAALKFVRELIALAGDRRWYLENPVSILSTEYRKPDQIIQPYEFGEDASKRTCLWLNRLPLLRRTKRVCGRLVSYKGNVVERWSNQTDSGQNRLPPSEDRWKQRSRSYRGIALAMAAQWSWQA